MKLAMLAVAIFLCLPLWAEEKAEIWPEFSANIDAEFSPDNTTLTLDIEVMNIRARRSSDRNTIQIDLSWRVIGQGKSCLHKPFLLGITNMQRGATTVLFPGQQELYFQVHYLTSRNSVRGLIPLMSHDGLVASIEVEKWELYTIRGKTKVLLHGYWSPKESDIGIGVARNLGRHIQIKVFTSAPSISVVFSTELSGISEH